MSKMIQLRNVPDRLHRKLKARAATEGRSLSEYLLNHIRELADRPTLQEMKDRLQDRAPIDVKPTHTDMLREERDRR